MKKDILKYILVMFLAVSFAACDDYDPEINYYDTAKLSLSDTKFTVLDTELETTIDFQTTTKTVGAVRFVYDGNEIGTGTAANNKVTVTLNRSDLDLSAIDDASRLYVYAMVDGKEKEMYTTISMVSATSIKDPFIEVDDEEEVDPIFELSDVVKNFTYKVSPKSASGVTVTASIKLNKDKTYTELWSKAYDAEDLDWGFKGSDYVKGDILALMLVAKVGAFTDTVTTSITVSEYLLGAINSIKVDIAMPGYDLVGDSVADITKTYCNLKFTHDYANLKQGVTGLNSTSFVLVDDEDDDLMAETNLPVLKAAFDAGTAAMVLDNIVADEKYIVMHTRGGKVYYGMIVITETNQVRDGDEDFVMMDFALEIYDDQK